NPPPAPHPAPGASSAGRADHESFAPPLPTGRYLLRATRTPGREGNARARWAAGPEEQPPARTPGAWTPCDPGRPGAGRRASHLFKEEDMGVRIAKRALLAGILSGAAFLTPAVGPAYGQHR